MAPSREACAVAVAMAAAAPFIAIASSNVETKRRRTSSEALQRTVSDVSYHLHHGGADEEEELRRPVPEVESAKCECCGMSEDCTPEYIQGVRRRFSGQWVCGLCAEAVTMEAEKNGGSMEEALRQHMAVCKRFNGYGRTHPVLFQAEAMRDILRKHSKLGPRSRSGINPRDLRKSAAAATPNAGAGGGIARSSSCMPFITESN